MLNQIAIMGRMTKDPELRHTGTGKAVASFTLAVDRDITDAEGNRGVDFIDCVAWQGVAEFVSKYFTKGRTAVVQGRLEGRKWTDRDGRNRVSYEVRAEHVYFGDSKKDGAQGSMAYNPSVAAAQPSTYAAPDNLRSDFAVLEDEETAAGLPF